MGLDRVVLFRLATSERFERVVKSLPGGEPLSWRAASRYLAGRSADEAVATMNRIQRDGHGVSLDLFGELVDDVAEADRVVDDYEQLDAVIADEPSNAAWLSADLSHLALDADPAGAVDRLGRIAAPLAGSGRRIQVGAEDARRTDAVLSCVLDAAGRGHADQLGATLQANLKRTPDDVSSLVDAGVHIRLVKGAYLEPAGAHPHGDPTDRAFRTLALRLADTTTNWSIATHDDSLLEALLPAIGAVTVEHLFGVHRPALDRLRDRGVATRIYVPYGPDWFRYWMRRLAEARGA